MKNSLRQKIHTFKSSSAALSWSCGEIERRERKRRINIARRNTARRRKPSERKIEPGSAASGCGTSIRRLVLLVEQRGIETLLCDADRHGLSLTKAHYVLRLAAKPKSENESRVHYLRLRG